MTTSQLIDAIREWTAANGRGPTFEELHAFFGGSDDTHVNLQRRAAADRYYLAVLEHTQ